MDKRRIAGAMAFAGSIWFAAGGGLAVANEPWREAGERGFKHGAFQPPLSAAERRGRDVWFKSTFGGEKFFGLILPKAPFDLRLGLDALIKSNRDTRFQSFGVVNDPDCRAGDASTGFFDRCRDPHATGVLGLRKFKGPKGETLVGVTCAACHAGFDPVRPPKDVNHPRWENIHPTIGNQFIDIGKIFNLHLSPHDPRYQIFQTWARGTVDTTAIESDHINNPGIITQFFDFPDRPFFDLTQNGQPIRVHRAAQGGEDDTGCESSGLRVFFNIGMCARECVIPHLANGPGGTQTPIDQNQCRAACPEFAEAEHAVVDMCAFMQTPRPPRLEQVRGGHRLIDREVLAAGRRAFEAECADCH